MQTDGRLKWQSSTGYGKRALIETAMGRYKGIIGPCLRARSIRAQQTEAAIGVAILNRMLACGRPKSVRCEGTDRGNEINDVSKTEFRTNDDPRATATIGIIVPRRSITPTTSAGAWDIGVAAPHPRIAIVLTRNS